MENSTTLNDKINYEAVLKENLFLKQMNSNLLVKIDELKTRLNKYTNGENHKRYYEKNKEKIKQVGATYLQKLKSENPEKIKEYSKRAYANKKKKLLEAAASNGIDASSASYGIDASASYGIDASASYGIDASASNNNIILQSNNGL